MLSCPCVSHSHITTTSQGRAPLIIYLCVEFVAPAHSIMSFLFGKKPSPEERAREWGRQLKREQRQCDREIRALEREEMKIKMELKRAAKKNQVSAVKTYAKAIVRSNNAKVRKNRRATSCVVALFLQ